MTVAGLSAGDDAAGLRWVEPVGTHGWLEREEKLGLKGRKKDWAEPRRRVGAGWNCGMRRCWPGLGREEITR